MNGRGGQIEISMVSMPMLVSVSYIGEFRLFFFFRGAQVSLNFITPPLKKTAQCSWCYDDSVSHRGVASSAVWFVINTLDKT